MLGWWMWRLVEECFIGVATKTRAETPVPMTWDLVAILVSCKLQNNDKPLTCIEWTSFGSARCSTNSSPNHHVDAPIEKGNPFHRPPNHRRPLQSTAMDSPDPPGPSIPHSLHVPRSNTWRAWSYTHGQDMEHRLHSPASAFAFTTVHRLRPV